MIAYENLMNIISNDKHIEMNFQKEKISLKNISY